MPSFLNTNTGTGMGWGTASDHQSLTANNDVAGVDFRHFTNGGIGVYVDDLTNWTGTITFEITRDPAATNTSTTTWTSVLMTADASGSTATTTTAKGNFYCNVVGVRKFRARLTSVGGNTAKVYIIANPG